MRVPKRQQSAEVGRVFVLVEMTTKHFRQGIPSRFAETIARNLDAVGLDDHFKATVKDVSRRNIGRSQIKVIGDGPIGNTLEIAVEPDIANSNENRFDCILYCPDSHPREEVKRLLGGKSVELVIEPTPTELAAPVQPESEPIQEGSTYPDLNDPRYQTELCQILEQVANHPKDEIHPSNLVNIVAKICGIEGKPERTIGRRVISKIASDNDSEDAILVIVRRESGSIRGYRLGQLGRSLMGIGTPKAAIPTVLPTTLPTPDPLTYVANLKKITSEAAQAAKDSEIIKVLNNLCAQTLVDIGDRDCRDRLTTVAGPLIEAMERETANCDQKAEQGKEAQVVLDELRRMLAES